MIDTGELRSLIDKCGPPLSPMLIFTLLDEIDRLRAELAAAQAAWLVEINTVARVRELCDNEGSYGGAYLPIPDVRTALEGAPRG